MSIDIHRHRFMLAAMVAAIAVCFATSPLARGQVVVDEDVEVAESSEGGEPGAAAPGEMKTIAVIAGAPYDGLLKDIDFIGSLIGQSRISQIIEMQLAFFTQQLDRTKPWGVIVQTDGAQFLATGCLPVGKPEELLGIAPAMGATVEDVDGQEGVKEIKLPNGKSFFVKSQNGWSFIAQSVGSLSRLPRDPQASLSKLVAEYDLAANVSVKNVPPMYRGILVSAMQSGMEQGLQKQDDETDEQFKQRRELAEAQMKQVVELIDEMDALTFGWAIDSQAQKTFFDFTYGFTPGGKMAKQLAAMEEPQTNFAGFYQPNSVATLTTAQKVDMSQVDAEWYKSQQAQSRQMLATWREQLLNGLKEDLEITDEEVLAAIDSAAKEVFDAATATLESGKMDAGAALDVKPGAIKFVGGAYFLEPKKVESALQKLSAVGDKLQFISAIEMNVGKHGDVNFHKVTVNVPEDQPEARDVLGEQVEIVVGVGQDALYAGIGNESMESLKQAMDASAAEPNKRVPMFELAVSLGPIMETLAAQAKEGSQRDLAQAIASMLKNDAQGRDHVRITGQNVNSSLRYRLEAEEGTLRALGKAALDAQRRQLEQQLQ